MKLKNTRIAGYVLSLFFLTGLFAVASPNAFGQQRGEKQNTNLAKQAKITMSQARAIARKRAAGKIKSEELEREGGKLVYSFDIRNSKGTITEVQVDAKTGKLLSAKVESKADEAKEKREDAQRAKKKGGKN